MSDLAHRMEALRFEREDTLVALNRNTIAMRLIVKESHNVGYGTRAIASMLGVTTNTVYSWLTR